MTAETTDTSKISDSPNLPEFDTRLVEALSRISPGLSNMYIGAKMALANSQNPERFRHAAASLRTLMDDWPKLDPRVNVTEDVAGMKMTLHAFEASTTQVATIKITTGDDVSEEDKVRIKTVVEEVIKLREYLAQSGGKYREKQSALLDALDTARANMPEADQNGMLDRWIKYKDFFNGVVHTGKTTDKEFNEKVQSFESLLKELLIPSAAENLDEIDAFIEEIEDE